MKQQVRSPQQDMWRALRQQETPALLLLITAFEELSVLILNTGSSQEFKHSLPVTFSGLLKLLKLPIFLRIEGSEPMP